MDTTCKWPECERTDKLRYLLCQKHYSRARRVKDFDEPWKLRTWDEVIDYGPACRWPSCGNPSLTRGLCQAHYSRSIRADVSDWTEPWLVVVPDQCEVCGEDISPHSRRFCSTLCGSRAWRADNHERWLELKSEWAAANPEKMRVMARANKYYRRTSKAAGESFDITDLRAEYGDDCYLCGKPVDFDIEHPDMQSPSLDHIKPVSQGGAHTVANCSMVHLLCNLRKGDRPTARRPRLISLLVK